MKEDTITTSIKKANQLQRETTLMRELLIGELTPTHEQDGKARKVGKAKTDDEREGNTNPPPPKMKPFWKLKKWFKIEDDFKQAMMVVLRGYGDCIGDPFEKILCMISLGDSRM